MLLTETKRESEAQSLFVIQKAEKNTEIQLKLMEFDNICSSNGTLKIWDGRGCAPLRALLGAV